MKAFFLFITSLFGFHTSTTLPPEHISPSTTVQVTTTVQANSEKYTATLTDGFQTDPRDGGRPVVLIASMLGVEAQVFRDVFSGVHPSKTGGPSEEEARANKKVLLDGLGKYGITNDRLDTVSNYYRYMGSRGETWPQRKAIVSFELVNGMPVTKIIDPGVGYTSVPTFTFSANGKTYTGYGKVHYTQDFKTNGSISALVFN